MANFKFLETEYQLKKLNLIKLKKMLLFFSYQSPYIFFVFKKYNIFFKKGKEKEELLQIKLLRWK